MNKYLNTLKETAPKEYSDTIKKIVSPVIVRIDNTTHKIGDMKYTGQPSSASFLDEMIVEQL